MKIKLKRSFLLFIDFLCKINIVSKNKKQIHMKKIILLFLLIGISSCCKEIDDCITFSWNVGIYHNTYNNSKHLSIEIFPHEGKVDATDFTTVWVFTNGTESTTIRLQDTEFDYMPFQKTGIKLVRWSSLNYILDDYDWVLKEVLINGRIKISGEWYTIDSIRSF